MADTTALDIAGTSVAVSNLDKVFYPQTGFTKGQVIDYYVRISPYLLPHLHGRPITLKRYPDGVDGFFFYEKNCPPHPKWVRTAIVPRTEGGDISYCLLDSLPALVWAVNLADLEIHSFLHKAPGLNRPTALAFDLDPAVPATLLSCCQVALWIKALFDRLHLKCFPKTSGSKGLQVYVPLNTPVTWDEVRGAVRGMKPTALQFAPDEVLKRVRTRGDLFAPILKLKQKLPALSVLDKLGTVTEIVER